MEDRVAKIEEKAEFERESTVIGLMMYLGNPPGLKEHLYTESSSKCLAMKEIAEQILNKLIKFLFRFRLSNCCFKFFKKEERESTFFVS